MFAKIIDWFKPDPAIDRLPAEQIDKAYKTNRWR
ncbi:hypothetical protein MNBD_IGNAVI01-2901, partial [hydrothermal vent metagenome]